MTVNLYINVDEIHSVWGMHFIVSLYPHQQIDFTGLYEINTVHIKQNTLIKQYIYIHNHDKYIWLLL